jgi:hypothetical protein
MRERHFNKREYDREINTLDTRIQALNKMEKILTRIDEKLETFEDYCKHLNTRTGFQNARMSAEALNELETYAEVERLDIAKGSIANNLIVKKDKSGYRLTAEALSEIRDRHTQYFTEKEESYLKQLEKASEILKNVPHQLADALYYNRLEGTYVVDVRKYNSLLNFVGSRL